MSVNAIIHTLYGVQFIGFRATDIATNIPTQRLYQLRVMGNNRLVIGFDKPTTNRNEMSFLVENGVSENRFLKGLLLNAAPNRKVVVFVETDINGQKAYYQRDIDLSDDEIMEMIRRDK